MNRGRPKGRSKDKKSYGPLGDLIRTYRLQKRLGLLEVAKACKCSVQFISNIEHGRAPLPWEKAERLSKYLGIPFEELQAANLSIRSDFQSFYQQSSKGLQKSAGRQSAPKVALMKDAASLVTMAAQDPQLRELLQKYQSASVATRKKFVQTAKKALSL